ncbi:MAG: glycoside hydrolase family 43 protein [Opitutaceae bacterium]|nr:glycoside hydrolase family 43 protein [Opitutaceae bacterium]
MITSRIPPVLTGSLLVASLSAPLLRADDPAPVSFGRFEYSGVDPRSAEVGPGEYGNPILTGFYPDPSLCRVGEDYYLTNSTFAYFPGLPVFHSRDLVNWTLIGHAIDRPDQLRYEGLRVSEGIFAPAITHHGGKFYMICTMVGSNGNFVLTADNPAGPWSEPHILRFTGIDPSLFFDDDGRAWVVNNDDPEGKPLYDGHRAIRIQEFDPKTMSTFGPRNVLVNGGVDLSTKPIWIEGPHLYKRDGWYYLSCAEGGTGPGHSQVVFRSRAVDGPYVPWGMNPILTQRDLDPRADGAVTCVGHADLEMGPDGRWWATFLGVRPYEGNFSPMGRETFLLPVEWTDDGWPTILPPSKRVPLKGATPGGVSVVANPSLPLRGSFAWHDEFRVAALSPAWIMLRTPPAGASWWSIDDFAGRIHLTPRGETLAGRSNPSYLGRRVQHVAFSASTSLVPPQAPGVSAGLVAFQNERHHYFLGVRRDADGLELFLEKAARGEPQVVQTARVPATTATLALRVEGDGPTCAFAWAVDGGGWQTLVKDADAKLLTTGVAGGFVGATVGMHARLDRSAD